MAVFKDVDVNLIDGPILEMHPSPSIDYLRELAESIKQVGQKQEITIRPVGERYQVIIGDCRRKAAQMFGIKTLRSRIEELGEKDSLLASATENIVRLEQDPLKEAELFQSLQEKYSMTDQQISQKFGKSAGYVTGRISLLQLAPDVQEMLKRKEVNLGVAVECSKLTLQQDQLLVAASFREQPVTVERAKAIIKDFTDYKKEMVKAKPKEVLELARAEPTSKCEICGENRKISKMKGIGICSTCYHGVIYLMEKEKREKASTE